MKEAAGTPVDVLARDDKWYLGAGDGIVFAPPFPTWLDEPGFWDEATVHQHAFAPLFTVAVIDRDGREVPLRAVSRRWSPAELTVEYRLATGITATEVRTVQPDGVFASEWQFRTLRRMRVHLVAWTAQPARSVDPDTPRWSGGVAFARTLRDAAGRSLNVAAELACVGGATSWAAYLGACPVNHPRWALTPFAEHWTTDGLPCELRTAAHAGGDEDALVFAAVHRAVDLETDGAAATFAMRLRLADPKLRPRRPSTPARPSGGVAALNAAATLGGASRRRWHEHFEHVPVFRCSDPYLETYYWYRWYALGLHAIAGGTAGYAHPAVCEGIGALHAPSAVGVGAAARELRWLPDAERARGVLRTFASRQREDGALPAHAPVLRDAEHASGDADWGEAVMAIDASHPDDAFLAEIYPALSRHASWLAQTRDARETGLLDAPDGGARQCVASAVYVYALFRALERIAPRAGDAEDAWRWRTHAERTARAIRSRMWRPELGRFVDLDAAGQPLPGLTAMAFYPYRTDLVGEEHVPGLERALLAPSRFWTAYPVPTTPLDDASFDPFGEVNGRRVGVPDNGRTLPVVNSHLVDALGRTAALLAPRLRAPAAHLLRRFIRMMFHDGDLRRANSLEHYNPVSGRAAMHRGLDDHLGAWVNDLLLQWVAGVRPHDGGITIDPFPFGLDLVEVRGLEVRGRHLEVRVEPERTIVRVDGHQRDAAPGEAIEIPD